MPSCSSSQLFREQTSHKPLHKMHPLSGPCKAEVIRSDPAIRRAHQHSPSVSVGSLITREGFRVLAPLARARLTHRNIHMYYSHSFWHKLWSEQNGKWQGILREEDREQCAASSRACNLLEGCGEAHPSVTWHHLVRALWQEAKTKLTFTYKSLHPETL